MDSEWLEVEIQIFKCKRADPLVSFVYSTIITLCYFLIIFILSKNKSKIKTISDNLELKFYYLFTVLLCTLFISLIAIMTKLLFAANIRNPAELYYNVSKDINTIINITILYHSLNIFCFLISCFCTVYIANSYVANYLL